MSLSKSAARTNGRRGIKKAKAKATKNTEDDSKTAESAEVVHKKQSLLKSTTPGKLAKRGKSAKRQTVPQTADSKSKSPEIAKTTEKTQNFQQETSSPPQQHSSGRLQNEGNQCIQSDQSRLGGDLQVPGHDFNLTNLAVSSHSNSQEASSAEAAVDHVQERERSTRHVRYLCGASTIIRKIRGATKTIKELARRGKNKLLIRKRVDIIRKVRFIESKTKAAVDEPQDAVRSKIRRARLQTNSPVKSLQKRPTKAERRAIARGKLLSGTVKKSESDVQTIKANQLEIERRC